MNTMKENIEKIFVAARTLYQLTDGKYTVSRGEQKLIQDIIDEMQEACDNIANKLIPWED